MDQTSSKRIELSAQLAAWWAAQTDFKTKRALAGHLEIHPDTLGDYFSGRKFPKPDIASRLGDLTKISCLNHDGANLPSGAVPQDSSTTPPLLAGASGVVSAGQPDNECHLAKSPEAHGQQPSRHFLKKGERQGHGAVVISLQRAGCPFCEHPIGGLANCAYCGQHFIRANVPLSRTFRHGHNDSGAVATIDLQA